MLHLTSPATTKRHKGGLATYPLLATRRFDQCSLGIATTAAMLTSHRLGFQAVVCHGVPLLGARAPSALIWDWTCLCASDHLCSGHPLSPISIPRRGLGPSETTREAPS